MSVLVVDVGTSSVRAAVVRPDATIHHVTAREVLPSTPAPGFVEFDPRAMAAATLEVATAALAAAGPVEAVGVTAQRASTVAWDRATGEPVGPGVGWQDLRTAGTCLLLQPQGFRFSPSMSATKMAFLLDLADPGRDRDLCVGTVDSWIAWTLSRGALHVTDLSNAGVTGVLDTSEPRWSTEVTAALRIPEAALPRLVDSTGVIGEASALPGSPPLAGLVGDQQGSLIGQGCVRSGLAKITFGTGGVLDLCLGAERPAVDGQPLVSRGPGGAYPVVAWSDAGHVAWGLEAIVLSAGSAVEWLRDDLGLIATAAESDAVASACADAGGTVFVPALLGLGSPVWDYGARGTLLGVTRGTGRPQIVRAVLEGVAHRGADLVDAAEADSGRSIPSLRVDGGMSANPTFLQALADAAGRPVEVSPVVEATTLGAAFLAGLAVGTWGGWDDVAATWAPRAVVEPSGRRSARARWLEARQRAERWEPDFSALEF